MTADEWDNCTDFHALRYAFHPQSLSTRKCHCFALASVRYLWERLSDVARNAIETTERFLERRASNRDRSRARTPLRDAVSAPEQAAYWAACAPTDIRAAAWGSAAFLIEKAVVDAEGPRGRDLLHDYFCRLIHDIIPNPFQSVNIVPAWLRWQDGTVYRIAETINDEADFTRLAVLADALEEAGCRNGRILEHLRRPGHVRGCWVIDGILGKE